MAVWSEGPVKTFEKLMGACGFRVEFHRPKYKGPRHVVYLGWPRSWNPPSCPDPIDYGPR